MSRFTPENKVKKMVRAVLAEFSSPISVKHQYSDVTFQVTMLKQFWPVPSGYGASDLDCIVCYYGVYIAIETKAPGKKPTPRQGLTIAETMGAGGRCLSIDGEAGCTELRRILTEIKYANDC